MSALDELHIPVLDHGYVELMRWMGPTPDDEFIPAAARISTGSPPRDPRQDRRLLGRLSRYQHSSPFEHAVYTFKIKAPLFVLRQWQRHRTWRYYSPSEASMRYQALDAPEFYLPLLLHRQGERNKQVGEGELDHNKASRALDLLRRKGVETSETYRELLDLGVSNEEARIVLPQATYTELFATVDLWNLADFWRLRLDEGAQREIRDYAEATWTLTYRRATLACDALFAALEGLGA